MSHHGPPHYPHGGPPPPFGSHPPPPAYGYVPAAVAMPVYPPHLADYPHPSPQPQPTYITNHYYPNNNPPPEPVHVVENAMPPPPQYQPVQDYIDWIPSTPNTAAPLTHKAVVAGKEPGWDSSPLWVIRAHHGGDLVPGKLAIRDRRAYIPIAGQEIPVHNFEVTFVCYEFSWFLKEGVKLDPDEGIINISKIHVVKLKTNALWW
uniref:Uncharacterized protein n=2 Tax=Pectinophora gossypiella TaxID=13191 RepID=A0A1E1WD90_PECGO